MARLWTAGAELQTATAGIEFTAITTTAPVVETTIKRSGNAAWRISNTSAFEGFRQVHTAAQGAFFFRFYLYIVAMPTVTSNIGGARITGSNKITIRLTSAGKLQLYNAEDSAQVGSDSSTTLSTATWYRIEMTYDSTTLASTTCEAKIDGTAFASGTVNLAGTPTSFGCFSDATDATLDYVVDDLAINDTTDSVQNGYPGEGEVIVLRPNGNGDNSDWGGSDGNSTDNYLLIDEVPPDTADYVEDNTSGQIDDYNLEATPAAMESSDTINVVHVGVYAAVSDATSSDPDIVLRIKASASGTVQESSSLDCNSLTYQGPAPLPANSNYQLTLYDLPGASTTAWTKADLDTAQAGVRVAVTDAHFARVAALWVMVDHKPGSGTIYNQSVDGAATPAGAILKSTSKSPSGTVTPAGALLKLMDKIFSGGITPAGALLKSVGKILEGTLTSSGGLSKLTSKILAGTLTSSGTLTTIRTFLVSLDGTLTSVGTLIKQTSKAFTGILTPSGALNELTSKIFGGTLTSAGNLSKATSKILSGGITPSGTLTIIRTFLVSVGGTLTSSGALLKSTAKSLAGSLTSSGGISKAIGKIIAGVLSFTGTLTSSGGGTPVEPVEQTFSPLDLDACFGNEKDLSAYGGETPDGIPGWVADQSADPTAPTFEPLDLDECIGAGKSLSVYSS